MTESALQAAILLRFGSHPQLRLFRSQPLVAKTATGRVVRALPSGWPDLTGLMAPSGRMLLIETKAPTSRVSPAQAKLHEVLRRWGALVIVARSVDDVADALRAAGVV